MVNNRDWNSYRIQVEFRLRLRMISVLLAVLSLDNTDYYSNSTDSSSVIRDNEVTPDVVCMTCVYLFDQGALVLIGNVLDSEEKSSCLLLSDKPK